MSTAARAVSRATPATRLARKASEALGREAGLGGRREHRHRHTIESRGMHVRHRHKRARVEHAHLARAVRRSELVTKRSQHEVGSDASITAASCWSKWHSPGCSSIDCTNLPCRESPLQPRACGRAVASGRPLRTAAHAATEGGTHSTHALLPHEANSVRASPTRLTRLTGATMTGVTQPMAAMRCDVACHWCGVCRSVNLSENTRPSVTLFFAVATHKSRCRCEASTRASARGIRSHTLRLLLSSKCVALLATIQRVFSVFEQTCAALLHERSLARLGCAGRGRRRGRRIGR